MRLSYAHKFTKSKPLDISGIVKREAPELEEIGGRSKAEVLDSVARFSRYLSNDPNAGDGIKLEVFKGEQIAMVTVTAGNFMMGWESNR